MRRRFYDDITCGCGGYRFGVVYLLLHKRRIGMKKKLEGEDLQNYIDSLCKQNGFDFAKYLGTYRGEEIYQPSFLEGDGVYFGYPVFLHVRNGKVRRSKNQKEAFTVGDFFL